MIISLDGSWPRCRLAMEATSDLLVIGDDAFEDGMKTTTTKEYMPSE